MLDKNTLTKVQNIVFDDEAKIKDRLDGAKLLLSADYLVKEVCVLLHSIVDSPDYPNQAKIKSASLLHTYEPEVVEAKVVTDTEKVKADLLSQYGVGFVDYQ